MSAQMTLAEINEVFVALGVNPIERDMRELRDLMAPAAYRGSHGIVYRTVLANGTGKLPNTERMHAELERDAI
ncbi:hypothetical protein [Lysobacter sp. F60174L2]|uniref:hypothetical protein n=1 Tax=Lysobacter sp. F60174L2 TaxID=3459295 RepID=UPI00403D6CE4